MRCTLCVYFNLKSLFPKHNIPMELSQTTYNMKDQVTWTGGGKGKKLEQFICYAFKTINKPVPKL